MIDPLSDEQLQEMTPDGAWVISRRSYQMAQEMLELRAKVRDMEAENQRIVTEQDAKTQKILRTYGKVEHIRREKKLAKLKRELEFATHHCAGIKQNAIWLIEEARWERDEARHLHMAVVEHLDRASAPAEAQHPFGEPIIERDGIGWSVTFERASCYFDADDSNAHDLKLTHRRGIAAKVLLEHLEREPEPTPEPVESQWGKLIKVQSDNWLAGDILAAGDGTIHIVGKGGLDHFSPELLRMSTLYRWVGSHCGGAQ